MPEQDNMNTNETNNDAISESESLLNELKKMVEGGAEATDATATEALDTAQAAYTAPATPDFQATTQPVETPAEGVAPAAPAEGYGAYTAPAAPDYTAPATPATPDYAATAAQPASYTTPAAQPASYTAGYQATAAAPQADPAAAATTGTEAATSPFDTPEAPKKKKGFLIPALIAAALLLAGLAFGLTQCGGCAVSDEEQIKAAASAAMDELANPSDKDLDELAQGIAEGFEATAGFNLEDLGITPKEYAQWVVGDMTYEVVEAAADGSTGFARVKVNSRDTDAFNTNFATEIQKMTESGLQDIDSYDALYKKIGEAMRTAMGNTGTTEGEVTFNLSKTDEGWAVNEDSKEACFSAILAGNAAYGSSTPSSGSATSDASKTDSNAAASSSSSSAASSSSSEKQAA